jgi:hypothetical protein
MTPAIHEILKKTNQFEKREDKIVYLRNSWSVPLGTVIKYALDSNVKWLLPVGEPPFKEAESVNTNNRLQAEVKRFYLFVEGGNTNLTKLKRESLFIQLLESIHPEDAKIVLRMKDKKDPYEGIDRSLILEAFPGLLTDEQVQEEVS